MLFGQYDPGPPLADIAALAQYFVLSLPGENYKMRGAN